MLIVKKKEKRKEPSARLDSFLKIAELNRRTHQPSQQSLC